MSRPPILIDDTQPRRAQENAKRGCAYLTLWLLLAALSVLLVTVIYIVYYQPNIVGLDLMENIELTEVSFQQTMTALQATAGANVAQAQLNAEQSANNESTRAALENQATQVAQEATSVSRDIIGTQTGIALNNAQQATRAALDFEATRSAFDRLATQAELQYQGTQAALSQNATAIALGFATQPPIVEDFMTQTPPPPPLFDEGFTNGVSAGLWDFGAVSDWGLSDDGLLTAQRNGAWLLTQRSDFTDYALDVQLIPLAGLYGDYYILLNAQTGSENPDGVALRLSHDGSRLVAAGLYRFSYDQMLTDAGLLNTGLEAVQAVQIDFVPPSDDLNIRIEVRGNRVSVIVNNQAVLNVTLEEPLEPGAVGLQLPIDAQIRRITLLP